MVHVLPDSIGEIHKILFHQTSVYQKDRQISTGIFKNILESFHKIGVRPEIFVLATHRNDFEKLFLEGEANEWNSPAKCLEYSDVRVSNRIWSKLAYAQDTCLITNSAKPAAVMTRSDRFKNTTRLLSKTSLLKKAGLQIMNPEEDFVLEGGQVYACSKAVLYSNPRDQEILERFEQEPIFVDSLTPKLIYGILDIRIPGSSAYCYMGYDHVDLIVSIFERKDTYDVFYVDFKDTTLSHGLWDERQRVLLNRRFREWDDRMQKMTERIERCLGKTNFHEIPGFIGFKPYRHHLEPFIYSGVNLLFLSLKDKDYACYLKCPSEIENEAQINERIESSLREANITPIPIIGNNESMNLAEITRSAGVRCLVKVLARR